MTRKKYKSIYETTYRYLEEGEVIQVGSDEMKWHGTWVIVNGVCKNIYTPGHHRLMRRKRDPIMDALREAEKNRATGELAEWWVELMGGVR